MGCCRERVNQIPKTYTYKDGDDFYGTEGTIENILEMNKFLKNNNIMGILCGGVLTKELPRKDIDIIISTNKISYKQKGIDWWKINYKNNYKINTNNITKELK